MKRLFSGMYWYCKEKEKIEVQFESFRSHYFYMGIYLQHEEDKQIFM